MNLMISFNQYDLIWNFLVKLNSFANILFILYTHRTTDEMSWHQDYLLGIDKGSPGSALHLGTYLDNTDGVGNLACCVHLGSLFAEAQWRGPRLDLCKQPPERDTSCEDFLPSLYCVYFTRWNIDVHFISILCVFCA